MIILQDDGVGMDEATRLRAFDPLFTTKEVGHGTGQGLSMAHAIIVQKHGGRIEVESAPGSGSTFIVVLPLTPSASSSDDDAAEADDDSPGSVGEASTQGDPQEGRP